MPTPTFKAVYSASKALSATSSTTLNVALQNIVAEDYLLAFFTLSDAEVLNTPTGYTLLHSTILNPAFGVFGRLAVGGETSVSFTHGGTGAGAVASVYVVSGGLLDVSALGSIAEVLSPVSPSVTTTKPDCLILAAFGTSAGNTWTPGSSMTERSDIRSGTDGTRDAGLMIQEIIQPVAESTGTKTATQIDNDACIGATVALKTSATEPPTGLTASVIIG